MKKVLLISCNTLGIGGVQTVMMNIVRHMSQNISFDMLLIAKGQQHYEAEFESYGGKIFRILPSKSRFARRFNYYLQGFRLYRKLPKILKEGKYDAIHCNNELDSSFCLKAAKKAGIPIRISHTHIINHTSHWIDRMYTGFRRHMIQKYATHMIGCSEEACVAAFGESMHYTVVNNPYASDKFVFKKKSRAFSPVFLQIGSFSTNKNQLFSLDVIAEIKKKYPDVMFHIVASVLGQSGMEFKNRVLEKVSALGLDENIVIYPQDANTPELLSGADYFLFPSKKEGFGIVAIEAQAVGVKVVASDTVPHATDCGGVIFLPLKNGADAWASVIIEDFKHTGGEHIAYDCSAFALEQVMGVYKGIYGGE